MASCHFGALTLPGTLEGCMFYSLLLPSWNLRKTRHHTRPLCRAGAWRCVSHSHAFTGHSLVEDGPVVLKQRTQARVVSTQGRERLIMRGMAVAAAGRDCMGQGPCIWDLNFS